MEDYNVISLFRPDYSSRTPVNDPSAAICALRREIRIMHARQAVAGVTRLAMFGGLTILGIQSIDLGWGGTLSFVAGVLALHSLFLAIKGHQRISRLKKAKLFWLQSDLENQNVAPVYLREQTSLVNRRSA
jgi:hypothetical protein